jgi:hypothetical protein
MMTKAEIFLSYSFIKVVLMIQIVGSRPDSYVSYNCELTTKAEHYSTLSFIISLDFRQGKLIVNSNLLDRPLEDRICRT